MKKSYSTNLNLSSVDMGLLIFRIAISGLMLTHGLPKLLTFFGSEEINFADPLGMGEMFSFTFAVFAEVVCSILLIVGLGTRLAVLPLIITMLVAALVVHVPDGLGKQELPLLYVAGYILLFFTGSGKHSLDWYFVYKNESRKNQKS